MGTNINTNTDRRPHLRWGHANLPCTALASALIILGCGVHAAPAVASPWAEVGDAQLRSDIQLLSAAGVLDRITTHWPLPWAGIRDSLRKAGALTGRPDNVRAAAERVWNIAQAQLKPGVLHARTTIDVTNAPSAVRGFDGMGREVAQSQISGEMIFDTTAIRISAGAQLSDWSNGQGNFLPDGSYIAQRIGEAVVYAGYLDHWWGPGWISALSLSNNARPFPQVGIERLTTKPFQSPWLSWIGAWQAEFFVGLLDGPRTDRNTLYSGLRVTFNPAPGLEIGLARTEEFCGEHHPCRPIADYFNFKNDPNDLNRVNDQGEFDIHYSGMVGGTAYELYTQIMNEDSNPITHSYSSHLFGGSLWLPFSGTTVRLTAEYTSSIPTLNILGFGNYFYGYAYNNYDYVDGMRYRGRTLGFSLDSDSRLASWQASWIGDRGWSYTLTYHRAWVSTPQNAFVNVVTSSPVTINLGEARIRMPLRWATVELAGRLQDDQFRPERGMEASLEAMLTFRR